MAMIKCSECGKDISDKAGACPNCGCPVEHTINKQDNSPIVKASSNINKKLDDIRKDEFQKDIKNKENEYKKEKNNRNYSIIFGVGFGVFLIFVGMVGVGFVFVIIGILLWFYYNSSMEKIKTRYKELLKLADGAEEYILCPFCKKNNIVSSVVQAGQAQSYGTTTIGENINPLRPFTHTNIKQGDTYTDIEYKTLWKCNDCGKTFDNPIRKIV